MTMVTNPGGQRDAPIASQAMPPGRAPKRGRRWLVAAAGIIVVLSFVGGAAGIVLTKGEQHTSSSAPTTSGTTALQQLQQWWSSARDDFIDLKNASAEAQQALDVIRPGALAAACQHVHDAAEVGLQSHLPSPNSELTAELQAAIEDFHSAAHMCLAVVAGSLRNYDSEFLSSMAEANRHMRAAEDIINKSLISV